MLLVCAPHFESHSLIYTFNNNLALVFMVKTASGQSDYLTDPDTEKKTLQIDFSLVSQF